MKKTFCFVFQHAASTALKQRAEAGSGGEYEQCKGALQL